MNKGMDSQLAEIIQEKQVNEDLLKWRLVFMPILRKELGEKREVW